MVKSNNKDYFFPLRVWLLDLCVLSPIALMTMMAVNGSEIFASDTPEFLGLVIVIGLAYSLPTLALIYLIYILCLRQNRDRRTTRVLCCAFCIAGVLLTFIFLFREDAYKFIFAYVVATIASFWIVPLKYQPIQEINIVSTMDNTLRLIPGQLYKVIKQFIDFDRTIHEPGETWVYQGTHFLPYDDGLTLHVLVDSQPRVYRLQWREEEQGPIIDNFRDYVEAVPNANQV